MGVICRRSVGVDLVVRGTNTSPEPQLNKTNRRDREVSSSIAIIF